MIPRLYVRSGVINDYLLNNGLGFISTCTECRVTEERNGNYYLDMTVPKSDRLASVIAPDMIIKAMPNLTDPPQLFEINNIKTNRDSLTVKANHIKNLLYRNCLRSDYKPSSQNPAQTMIDGTPQEIVSRYLSYLAVSESRFSFSSDIMTTRAFESTAHKSKLLGELFSDSVGGLLYYFGGEYHYDNFHIELLQSRGAATTHKVIFGGNLSDYEQVATTDAAYTHIQGWCKVYNIGSKTDYYISGTPYAAKPSAIFPKMKMVDFTEDIRNIYGADVTAARESDIKQDLTRLSQQFYQNKIIYHENAQVSIEITYEPDLDRMQNIALCDTLKVVIGRQEPLRTQVTSIVFDSLAEKVVNVGIGDARTTLSDFISKLRR